MRTRYLLPCLLFLSLTPLAQQAPGQGNTNNTTGGGPGTIVGCVSGVNGSFYLATPSGERYLLKGHHDSLFHFNGKEVRITGTASPTKPQTLKISKIEKVNDTCQ